MSPAIRRRTLLAAMAASVLGGPVLQGCDLRPAGDTPAPPWAPSNPLRIPPVLEPRRRGDRLELSLVTQAGTHEFVAGKPTPSWGINGSILGPTLRLRRGQTVSLSVRNRLPELTTLHWHGLDVPAVVDGGPHQPIRPSATWTPQLHIDQPATTAWYHPHPHGATALHVHRGLAGLLLVDDESAPVGLPHRYGIDDFPLVLQDRSIDADGQSVLTSEPNFGYMGPDMCVNATMQAYLDITTDHVRLRILNGSNARLYNLSFADRRDFAVVANDSGLLPAPVSADAVRLGPAERVEIVVPMAAGERVTLRTTHGDERIDAGDLGLLELRAGRQLQRVAAPPASLGGRGPLVPPANATVRRFRLQGHDAINGQSMDMTRIDEVVPRSALEVWELENTVYAHNFHIHGLSFSILDVNGQPPPAWASGRKDTVHLPPRAKARLAVQVGQHVDPHHPYMYHCHILRHEDAGMMGQYVVVEPGTEGRTSRTLKHVSPHPSGHG